MRRTQVARVGLALAVGLTTVVLTAAVGEAASTGIWQPVADFIRGFIGLMYLLAGVGVLGGLVWSGYQMSYQSEYGGIGRGMMGIAGCVIFGIGVFIIAPQYVNTAISQGATLTDVRR